MSALDARASLAHRFPHLVEVPNSAGAILANFTKSRPEPPAAPIPVPGRAASPASSRPNGCPAEPSFRAAGTVAEPVAREDLAGLVGVEGGSAASNASTQRLRECPASRTGPAGRDTSRGRLRGQAGDELRQLARRHRLRVARESPSSPRGPAARPPARSRAAACSARDDLDPRLRPAGTGTPARAAAIESSRGGRGLPGPNTTPGRRTIHGPFQLARRASSPSSLDRPYQERAAAGRRPSPGAVRGRTGGRLARHEDEHARPARRASPPPRADARCRAR